MTNDQSNPNALNPKRPYDLEERTLRFSKAVIDFTKGLSINPITRPLISQLVRSATSIGANYCEADEASSKKDFVNKISIANKESKEIKYWLNVIAHTIPASKPRARVLWQEDQELNLILAAIIRSAKKKN